MNASLEVSRFQPSLFADYDERKNKNKAVSQQVDFARMPASVWPSDDTVGETQNERKGLLTWLIFGWLGITAANASWISC